MQYTHPQSILITGASSGIGEALALHYAAPNVTLFITGRDALRLNVVADALTAKGAVVYMQIIDVTDRVAMEKFVAQCDATKPLDLVIANAGIGNGGGRFPTTTDLSRARDMFEINATGVLNTIDPALICMGQRKCGQIAVMASLAGYSGLSSAPMYSATKNFVKAYGQALRGSMQSHGIAVNVICPGFVQSRITLANVFKMPLLMNGAKAAGIIARGLARNKTCIAFPWPLVFGVWLLGILPAWLHFLITNKIPAKA